MNEDIEAKVDLLQREVLYEIFSYRDTVEREFVAPVRVELYKIQMRLKGRRESGSFPAIQETLRAEITEIQSALRFYDRHKHKLEEFPEPDKTLLDNKHRSRG